MSERRLAPTTLVGQWGFERVVADRREGRKVRATGTATLVAVDADRIDWSEEGTLHLEGGPVAIAAHRVLRLESSGAWAVEFADGRDFHAWLPGEEVLHGCAPDDYAGFIDGDSDRWTTRWRALGPAKDYVIDTVYSRVTGM